MRAPPVAVVWRLGLIVFGFAAATLVAALSYAPTARAQEPNAPARTTATAAPARSVTAPSARDQVSDLANAYEAAPSPRIRGSIGGGYDDDGEEGGDPLDSDPLADEIDPSESLTGETGEREAMQPVDGLTPADGRLDLGEPEPWNDGSDLGRDTRPSEDLDVFNNPPAGHDPLLFQIEDIDPVETDRRPARFARIEPYDPVGISIGSFVLFPEAELGGLYTSNVLSTPRARSDIAGEIRTEARLVSNWNVHAVELRGTTFSTYHDDYPSEDDRAWSAEARGRLDISRRTNLQGLVGRSVSQEDRTAVDANVTGERAQVHSDEARLAFNHRFNRLAVELRGSVSDTTYSMPHDGESIADRDTLETRQAVRASWELKPTLAVFAEGELNQRDKKEAPADGIRRDSDGVRTRVGLDFGSTGAILRGQASIGYGHQSPRDGRLASVDAFLFDANLALRPSEITSLMLTASSDIYDTTTEESGGVVSHRIGIEGRHAFRRHLIGSAGLSYTHYDFHSTPISESAVTAFVGAEYYASPELVLFARYQHLSFASNDVNGDYETDEVRVGVRVRR
ncbi:outer membrane beta-barrel protein [Hyphomicrobium sp.]|uniref:outer membrane beta-barrel protein n=1 Tax=Hyphomicrobium sp. TaxID=82 RepID=UPI002BBADDB3|nr:outer membrane beta-barrel protein [Hyphomicrobium sp.]HRN87205.1 outer membrane beta-barrel protein [Hyphomicrobium sp.]HRQ25827.1 outer membrane beta-barrel protein [Hyphomicrobium sp.]